MTWTVYTQEHTYGEKDLRDDINRARAQQGEDSHQVRYLRFRKFLQELGLAQYFGVHNYNADDNDGTAYWFDPRWPNDLHTVRYRDHQWSKA